MNDRDKLITQLIREKGGTREQYLQLLNAISFHESAQTNDPTIKQKGGGPGRGKYQFEIGKNRGAITAARRTKAYLKEIGENIPAWLKKATAKNDLDVSGLTSEQQDALFLGNMRKHPKADMKNVVEGKQTIPEFWANYHWAGNSKDKPKRLRSFNKDFEDYNAKQREVEEAPKELQRPEVAKDAMNIKQPQIRQFKDGGNINGFKPLDYGLNEFKGGGTHEQNPLGGIPQGKGSNGKLNTVESGETSYTFTGGKKFIFSNRIFTTGKGKLSHAGFAYQMADGGFVDPVDPPSKEETVADSRDFVYNWFDSNVTKSRLAQNLGKAPYDLIEPVKKGRQAVRDATVKYDQPSSNPAAGAMYKNNNIDFYSKPTPETATHEFTHAMGLDDDLTKYIRTKYGTPATAIQKKTGLPFKEAVAQEHDIDTSNFIGRGILDKTIEHSRYLSEDGELYPRIMEMRKTLNVKPGDIIDDTHIEQLQKGNNPMFKYYEPEQIKDMLNKMARVDKNKKKYNNLV